MRLKCLDCLIQMKEHLSQWTGMKIYACPKCDIEIREMGDDE